MTSDQIYELIGLAALLIGVVLVVFLLAIRRLRQRKAELLGEKKASPRLNADRAFNRLEMARREASILGRQGLDISEARALIARSQAAFDLGKTAEAYELAQSAHESLVAVRHGSPLPASPSGSAPEPLASTPPTRSPSNGGTRASMSARPVAPPTGAGLPKNQMESQFEMRLLDADLASAKQARPADPATLAAIDFQSKAQSAYAGGRYTEAFSFALKGRRGLGGNLGTVGLTPGVKLAAPEANAIDPNQAAERAASATRCPHCGYPTTPDDAFCRGCGSPRTPTVCPQCGSPRVPADTFCGRCGARFS